MIKYGIKKERILNEKRNKKIVITVVEASIFMYGVYTFHNDTQDRAFVYEVDQDSNMVVMVR